MANLFEPPRYIAVEGPIRVGKSTLCQVIAETLHAQRISEPERNPFLRPFYDGEPGRPFRRSSPSSSRAMSSWAAWT